MNRIIMVLVLTPGGLVGIRHRLLPITALIFIRTIFLSGIHQAIPLITGSMVVITVTGARLIRITGVTGIRAKAGSW